MEHCVVIGCDLLAFETRFGRPYCFAHLFKIRERRTYGQAPKS